MIPEADQPASIPGPAAPQAPAAKPSSQEGAAVSIGWASPSDRAAIEALFDASLHAAAGDDAKRVLERAKAQSLSLLDASARTVLQRRSADDAQGDDPRETDNDAIAWLWVALESGSDLVGVAALRRLGEHEVELTRIEVHPDRRRMGIATGLLERILSFCHDHGHLKVVLYTDSTEAPAISLFRKFKFHFHRARSEGQRDRLEYYLDLYQRPDAAHEAGA